jgi:hypothetical protein
VAGFGVTAFMATRKRDALDAATKGFGGEAAEGVIS